MKRILSILFFCISFSMLGQEKHYNLYNGVYMAKGYDVVAYFENEVQEGIDEYRTVYQGAVYRFADEEHLKSFIDHPQKYIPQYGGWCAYAMGTHGEKVKSSPNHYAIKNGKLYLFAWSAFKAPKDKWLESVEKYISKGNNNWREILKN